jgi:primosomal protein N' (replication factor Y) (superfamily II helicase)
VPEPTERAAARRAARPANRLGRPAAKAANTHRAVGTETAEAVGTQAGSGQAARTRPSGSRTRRARRVTVPAERLPVARVAVDVPLAHLDRPFDYLVPERLAETARPGCRVRVRFAGQLTGGYLLSREAASEHPGRLAFLERVVSPEPVLTPEIASLAREVADRYAGTLADVLRLAIPPRHAAAEAAKAAAGPARERRPTAAQADGPLAPRTVPGTVPGTAPGTVRGRAPATGPRPVPVPRPEPGPWARYTAGEAFLAAVAGGRVPRAAWSALPGSLWAEEIARAVGTAASAGRGALIVVPDTRDLGRVDAALTALLGRGQHVCLAAGLGPAERYRRWLSVLRGETRIVAGLRAAMFAPVRDLGLVVIWDDGDDLHSERRAPYPHAREVLALRAHRQQAAALIGGFARTAETTQLVQAGWAHPIVAGRSTVRALAPLIRGTGDEAELARDEAAAAARLPSLALRTARDALGRGPVLVQVPRRGYLAAVACGRCREQARCAVCGGPLALGTADAPPQCGWCGSLAAAWRCPHCGHAGLRSIVTGAARTAEELGRAFPSVPVRTSRGQAVIASVPETPALVVATPGAEPAACGGYAAALLLDGWILAGRATLRAAEEALRRWLNAAALVRPAAEGGRVVTVADSSLPAVQALIRWDPVRHSERELAEREHLRFPPSVRMGAALGPQTAVTGLIEAARLPPGADVLGPVPAVPGAPGTGDAEDGEVRVFVRVPRAHGAGLARALQAAQAVRSARKAIGVVRVHMDPVDLI